MFDNVKIFDSNVMVGRYTVYNENSYYTVGDLIDYMDHYGIYKSLIFHSTSKEYDPEYGNNLLLKEVDNLEQNLKKRFSICYTICPRFSRTIISPRDLIFKIRKNGFNAIRVFPEIRNYSLKKRNFDEYFIKLEKFRVPVLIDYGNIFPFYESICWEDVYNICNEYPDIPFILIRPGFKSSKDIYLLLKNTRNLSIEFSGYWNFRAIESITEEFGSDRLIYGSNMPHDNPGCSLGILKFANITRTDREKISFKNLNNILNW